MRLRWEIQPRVEVRGFVQMIDGVRRVVMVATSLAAQRLNVVVRMAMRDLRGGLVDVGQQCGGVSDPAHEHGQEQRYYHLCSDSVAKHFRSTSPEE